MNIRHLLPALLVATFSAVALPAAAQQKLLPAQSSMAFEIKQMGVPVQGHFKKFDAQINFDAAKLAASKVNFTVDIASTTLGAPEMDSELPKPTWFNTAKFPQAQFTSSAFKALGGGKYEVTGKLAIKGQSRDVTVPLSMTQAGAITTASGVLPIKRLAFKIGEGDWADTSMVADDVQVRFKLALSGIPKLP
ncbi:MAG: YceI family protein [Rhodoferax sp.]|jgi:polyisoprenoid-binding protein YceI|nr:YceI family protein [Rhodoferax sp.]